MKDSDNEHCSSWIELADGTRVPNPDATNTQPNPGKTVSKRLAEAAAKPTTKKAKE